MNVRSGNALGLWLLVAIFLPAFLERGLYTSPLSDSQAATADFSQGQPRVDSRTNSLKPFATPKKSSFDARKFSTFAKPVSFQAPKSRTITQAYQFPVLPGTDAWARRVISESPWSLCEIPLAVLTNLTDAALVETCLHYPMRADLYYFDTMAKGLQTEIDRFNGFRELLSRSGTAALLKDDYLALDVNDFEASGTNHKMGLLDLGFKSTLLLRCELLTCLTPPEAEALCEKALRFLVKIRERYGRSADEESPARLAASLLYGGVEIQTGVGYLGSSMVFTATTPYSGPQEALGNTTLDALYSLGKHLAPPGNPLKEPAR